MRSASSYRGARKQGAKAVGMSLPRYNQAFDIAARAAESAPPEEARDAARAKLAIWAANGGRETALSPAISDPALKRMNEAAVAHTLQTTPPDAPISAPAEATVEQATAAAKKLTVEDVDKALEKALTGWQGAGREGPMPLSPMFAARARQLLWVEGVEFIEKLVNHDGEIKYRRTDGH